MKSRAGFDLRARSVFVFAVLLVAFGIGVATAMQAIREDSWGPVWAAGWLPAVVVAGLYRPARGCRLPTRRRSGA